MRRLFCIAMLVWPGLAMAELVGFAKFSPLAVSASPEMTDTQPRDMAFGAPLVLLEQTDTAAQVKLGEDAVWVHRADILVPDTERYMAAGAGFNVKERPVLRFWRSLGVATEFLSATDVRSAAPDLEEIRTDQRLRDLRLPILTRDVVDVMGARPVPMAAVMLPLNGQVAARFDALRGAQQRRYDIALVVDASPDALAFSADTADYIYRQISRYLDKVGDTADIQLTVFGANFWTGFETVGTVDGARIIDQVTGPKGAVADHHEPLLATLQAVAGQMDDSADQRLVIALSGGDIVQTYYAAALKKQVTLSAPELSFPENTDVILAQVTPEPGRGLSLLGKAPVRANSVSYAGFSENLGNQVMQMVRDLLGADTERPLSQQDLNDLCQAGLGSSIPCVLPYAPTTASVLPRPTRRGINSEWFSTIVWVVDDGLILNTLEPGQ